MLGFITKFRADFEAKLAQARRSAGAPVGGVGANA
jgi:hypothetical protein